MDAGAFDEDLVSKQVVQLNARLLEPLGSLNIQLGLSMKMGTDIGLKLVR